jgi:endoglucanase
MSRRKVTAVAVAGGLALLIAALVVGVVVGRSTRTGDPAAVGTPTGTSTSPASPAAAGLRPYTTTEAGRAFLSRWVQGDGRVVRTDTGGDTVSQGQAYALLVAVGLGDRSTFDAVWTWTQNALQRPDGLLSRQWDAGRVVDPSSASDADLDTARALVLAGGRFGDPRYTAAGTALGQAVLDLETVQTGAGRILTAGQWAMTEPYPYDPGYASPGAIAVLGAASGDPRWAELAAGSRAITAALLTEAPLPPDWAQVHADGTVEAMPGPQGRGQSVRYGYDAARTSIRLAESCDPADRSLAAGMAGALDRGQDGAELDLGGTRLGTATSVVTATAQAAAVAAAGDTARAVQQLADGDSLAQSVPSWYGAAWAALGHLLLTDDALGGCPPLPATS